MKEKSNPIDSSTPVIDLPGVGPATAAKFERLGLTSVADLIEWLPRRLEVYDTITPMNQLVVGPVVVKGEVVSVFVRRSQRGLAVVQVRMRDQTGQITAVWFNQSWLAQHLKEGEVLILAGTWRLIRGGKQLIVNKIVPALGSWPIYPATAGLSQNLIRRTLKTIAPLLAQLDDTLPDELRRDLRLPTRAQSLTNGHFGQTIEQLETAKRYLAYEELVSLGLSLELLKRRRQATPASALKTGQVRVTDWEKALGFNLTAGQQAVWKELAEHLEKEQPSRHLVYGDVGSGKTAVAVLAVAAALANGRSVAWLNPTLTLANQQFTKLEAVVADLGYKVSRLTGKDGDEEADLVVGTQAVLNRFNSSKPLGLVVIDEQHRFGVNARTKLIQDYPEANLLMMTATPIPRSLVQTLLGHLTVSYLLERPKHQQKIETLLLVEKQRTEAEGIIAERLAMGEPGYVIVPHIDESADELVDKVKTIESEEKRLKKVFPKARLGVLHGRLDNLAKQKVWQDFQGGDIDILLATTLVEVGLDNPAASWILIESADQFGLATLHQLRGRVGRGSRASVCLMIASENTDRLNILLTAENGLEIAEADLGNRGAGDFLGTTQSGRPPLRWANLSDAKLVNESFAWAKRLAEDKTPLPSGLIEKIRNWL